MPSDGFPVSLDKNKQQAAILLDIALEFTSASP
jgi:hypothetical protein